MACRSAHLPQGLSPSGPTRREVPSMIFRNHRPDYNLLSMSLLPLFSHACVIWMCFSVVSPHCERAHDVEIGIQLVNFCSGRREIIIRERGDRMRTFAYLQCKSACARGAQACAQLENNSTTRCPRRSTEGTSEIVGQYICSFKPPNARVRV